MSKFGNRILRTDERGSTLIELALTLPVFAIIFAGLVNYSLFVFKAVQIQEAASAGAAYGTLPGNASDVNGMQTAAQNASPAISNMSVTAATIYMCTAGGSLTSSSTICSSGKTPLKYVQVKTSTSAPPIANFPGLSPTLQLTGSATMRVPWSP